MNEALFGLNPQHAAMQSDQAMNQLTLAKRMNTSG